MVVVMFNVNFTPAVSMTSKKARKQKEHLCCKVRSQELKSPPVVIEAVQGQRVLGKRKVSFMQIAKRFFVSRKAVGVSYSSRMSCGVHMEYKIKNCCQ